MATGRILKKSVEAIPLPSGSTRAYLWDDQLKGFGVMVTPAGARSYLVQYRIGGRGAPTRRYTIGRHGSPWTADTARERARDLLEMVRKKIDPLDADRAKLAEAAASKEDADRYALVTYSEMFIRRHAEARNLRSASDIRATFKRDIIPHLGAKSIRSIRRSEVQACLDLVGERSGSAANKAHKWLHKLFAFAVNRGDVPASPMTGMDKPHQEGKRSRVLKGGELVTVWQAAGDVGEPWAALVRLLILTGQRLREVARMDWAELDLEAARWIIPGARTKNKRDHLVPLSPQVVALLRSIAANPPKRGPVLTTNGTAPIAGFSKAKKRLDEKVQGRIAEAAGGSGNLPMPLEPWVLHDLRRSTSTGCQALGFPKEHVHAAINHRSGGKRDALSETYMLYEYHEEKTAVFNAWARHVEALVGGERAKVLPFARAAAL